jgi:hypothetical protein
MAVGWDVCLLDKKDCAGAGDLFRGGAVFADAKL